MRAPLRVRSVFLAVMLAAGALASQRVLAAVDGVEAAPEHIWMEIKDYTSAQRDLFSQGMGRMSARLDVEINELKTKRASMTGDTKDWDFNMKEVDSSRSLLTARIADVSKANTPEDWADAKDKLHDAWQRSQLAVDKMNSTVTS
jgi:hypothetical protein